MSSARSSRAPAESVRPQRKPPSGAIRLAPDAALVWDGAGETVLQIGDQVIRINDVAAALLALCDGRRDVQTVVREAGRGEDAADFLSAALELGWVVAVG